MANSTTHSDNTRSSTGPGVEMRWPAAVLWRTDEPTVRKITTTDVWEALAQGFDDFRAIPTHAFFICLIYPVAGLVLYRLSFGYEMLPLLYPLVAGFALLGPFIAIGLYELSRRREQDPNVSPMRAFDVMHRPSFGAICRLGLLLAAIFVAWLYAANLIYVQIFGNAVPPPAEFINQVTDNRKRHAAHHRRQRRRIFVCGIRARDQRRLVPDARRPQRQRRNSRQNIGARRDREPYPNRAMGTDRRLFAPDRSSAVARRLGDRSARPWARDVAPLPETRRARIKSACSYSVDTSRPPTHAGPSHMTAAIQGHRTKVLRDRKKIPAGL